MSGGQWLGVGWAPRRGRGGTSPPSNASPPPGAGGDAPCDAPTGGVKAPQVCRAVLPGLRTGLRVVEGVYMAQAKPRGGGVDGAVGPLPHEALRLPRWRPSRAGARDALHEVCPKAMEFGGCSPPPTQATPAEGGGGGGGDDRPGQ